MGAVIVALLLAAVVASAIGVVYARQQDRILFGALTLLTREQDDLNTEFGRLELEQATWAEPNRIEQIARGQLGMVNPGAADTVVVKK
ncbi:MAG TPA: cell division protein FtsL [Rudaea sp.]|nr:cell division protein FtsL [Rudaea sp.]